MKSNKKVLKYYSLRILLVFFCYILTSYKLISKDGSYLYTHTPNSNGWIMEVKIKWKFTKFDDVLLCIVSKVNENPIGYMYNGERYNSKEILSFYGSHCKSGPYLIADVYHRQNNLGEYDFKEISIGTGALDGYWLSEKEPLNLNYQQYKDQLLDFNLRNLVITYRSTSHCKKPEEYIKNNLLETKDSGSNSSDSNNSSSENNPDNKVNYELEQNKYNLKQADEMYERLEFEQAFTMYKELEGKQGISQSHIKNRINTIESILSQRKTNIYNQSYNDKKSSINKSNKSTENSSKEKNKSKNTLNNSKNKDIEKENKDRKEDNKKDESDDIAEVIRRQNSYDREKKRERDSRNGNAQAVTGTQLAGWISVILFMFDGMGKGDKDNVFKDEFADHFSFKIGPSIESVPSMILEKKEIYNARTNKYSYKEEISNASGGGMGFQGSLSYWPVYSNLFGFGAELEGSAAFIFGSYSYSGSFGFNSLIGFDEFQFYSKLERGMRRAGFTDFASTREDELIEGGSKSKYSAFSIGPRFNWGRRKHLTVAIRFEDQNLNSFKHKSIKHWDKGLFFQYSKDNFLDITLLLQATSLFRKHFSNKFSNATLSNNRSYFNLSVKRHFDVFGKYSRKMVKNKKNIKKNKVTNQRVYLLNGTISKLNFKKDFRKNTHLQLGTTLTRYEMEKNLIDNLSIGYGIGTSFETLQWYNYYPNTVEINLFHLNVPINLYYSFPKFANKFFDFEENIDFWLSTGYRFNYTIMQNDKNEKFEINKIGHYYSFGFGFDYSIFRSGFEFNIRNNDIYKNEKIKSLGISYIFGILI